MELLPKILIGIIAFLHLYIMWFEMFAWESRGPKVFRNFPKDLFPKTKALAAKEQYNNKLKFLAASFVLIFHFKINHLSR